VFRQYQLNRFDVLLALMVIGLSIFGVFAIGSATNIDTYANRQIFGVVLGTIIMLMVACIDYRFIGKFYWFIYVFNLLFLLSVLLFGSDAKGATRWIDLGIATIQPSEFNKIFMVIFLAKIIDKNKEKINSPFFLLQIVILVGAPMLLIFKQPDLSTSMVLIFMLVIMVFVAEINYKYVLSVLALAIPTLTFLFWYVLQPTQSLLKDYQVRRILALIYPEEYLLSEAYQQYNSILAIGSGQLYGKGIYNGTVTSVKNTNFLSEPQTDFIFSVIGEELGFVGGSLLIVAIFIIAIKCILIAKDAKDLYGMLIVTGIVSIIIFQTFVNVGVATALLPNTGIPLPFISYGLSSLLSNMIGIGLILNISMQRKGLIKRG
jgi:rod shape determining protein RodA